MPCLGGIGTQYHYLRFQEKVSKILNKSAISQINIKLSYLGPHYTINNARLEQPDFAPSIQVS